MFIVLAAKIKQINTFVKGEQEKKSHRLNMEPVGLLKVTIRNDYFFTIFLVNTLPSETS